MDATAVAEFAQQSAESRAAVFGALTAPGGITYQGKNYKAVVSTITTTRELESGGWGHTVTTLVRVLRCLTAFAPVEGQLLTLVSTGQVLRITEIKSNVPAEWILGCTDPEA